MPLLSVALQDCLDARDVGVVREDQSAHSLVAGARVEPYLEPIRGASFDDGAATAGQPSLQLGDRVGGRRGWMLVERAHPTMLIR